METRSHLVHPLNYRPLLPSARTNSRRQLPLPNDTAVAETTAQFVEMFGPIGCSQKGASPSGLSGLKQYGGGSLFRETCAEMNTAGVSLQAYARTFLKIVSTTYPFDQMTTDQDLATLERLLEDCPDAGGSPPPKATSVSRQPQVSARQGTQPPTQTQKATKLLKELWPKPANQPAATGICTLLIGDDPPEIDVSGYVTVWNPTADQEIEADECDMWHWDSVYGR